MRGNGSDQEPPEVTTGRAAVRTGGAAARTGGAVVRTAEAPGRVERAVVGGDDDADWVRRAALPREAGFRGGAMEVDGAVSEVAAEVAGTAVSSGPCEAPAVTSVVRRPGAVRAATMASMPEPAIAAAVTARVTRANRRMAWSRATRGELIGFEPRWPWRRSGPVR